MTGKRLDSERECGDRDDEAGQEEVVSREDWGREVTGNLSLFLPFSLSPSLVKFGLGELQIQARQPLAFFEVPAEGVWQLVVLTSTTVNNAFSSSSWSPGSL